MNSVEKIQLPLAAARSVLGRRPARPRRILLTRVQNLGDSVVFLPTIHRVRAALPDAVIDVLSGTGAGEAVFRMCPAVDGLVKTSWPRKRSRDERLAEIAELQQRRYDTVLISTEETGSALKMLAAGIPWRVGFGRIEHMGETHIERRPRLLNRVLRQIPGWHEVDVNLQLAGALRCPDVPREFPMAPPPDAQKAASGLMAAEKLEPGRFVCVHAGTKQQVKRWPPAAFAIACDAAAAAGLRVVFIGTEEEGPLVQSVRDLMREPSVDLTGRTGVEELTAVFKQAAGFLGNDSGPMHLAAACELPVAAVFLASDPVVWGPYCPDARRRVFDESCTAPAVAAGLLQIVATCGEGGVS
jgi:heptosyltransferase-3